MRGKHGEVIMKRMILSCCLLMVLSAVCSAKQKIAVFPFTGIRNDYNVTILAEQEMISLLVNQKRFDVIERDQLQSIIKEQKLAFTGVIDVSDAVEIGKIGGIRYAVIGTVPNVNYSSQQKYDENGKPYLEVDALVVVQLRIVDIQTAAVIFSETYNAKPGGGFLGIGRNVSGDAETTLAGTVKSVYEKKVANDMLNTFPMSGYILSVGEKGKTVTIDIGSEVGVKKKMKFDVIKEETKIHPKTKKEITVEKKVGLIQVIEVAGKESAICKIKDGEDINEDMMKVKLQKK